MDGLAARLSASSRRALDAGRRPATLSAARLLAVLVPSTLTRRRSFVEGAVIASSGGFPAIAIAIGLSVWRAQEAKEAVTYGSARWANAREVQGAGLLGPDGVALGRVGRAYLRHDGPEHVLCFAPTRSGKGVGLVVPTLLTWPGSAIVHDIKGENWQLTAGWRARFGRVLLFDPTNPDSAAYNPLLEVRRGDAEVRDAQNVADILVDPEGALERRNHWEKMSHSRCQIIWSTCVMPCLRVAPTSTLPRGSAIRNGRTPPQPNKSFDIK